ncbi:hypothetical protein VNO77_33753 [Canavalia gladiata]|uniref:Uncharacterized protein n=1 Tax=Canavalia gladiata TaxID=3824 RepID=A0AAN9PXZ8_CANGL
MQLFNLPQVNLLVYQCQFQILMTLITNTDDLVSIEFSDNVYSCENPSSWGLVNDEFAKMSYTDMTCGGDKPSNQIKKGTFQIQEFNSNSTLTFCDGAVKMLGYMLIRLKVVV